MITGLDCRMTSLFLNHTSGRGEQSNPQCTKANMLQRQSLHSSHSAATVSELEGQRSEGDQLQHPTVEDVQQISPWIIQHACS